MRTPPDPTEAEVVFATPSTERAYSGKATLRLDTHFDTRVGESVPVITFTVNSETDRRPVETQLSLMFKSFDAAIRLATFIREAIEEAVSIVEGDGSPEEPDDAADVACGICGGAVQATDPSVSLEESSLGEMVNPFLEDRVTSHVSCLTPGQLEVARALLQALRGDTG